MEILFSDEFREEFKKIKDKTTRLRIIKQIKKLSELPDAGKPLKHDLKNHRSLRIPPFRLIYRIENDKMIINCFDHRKDVYD
jgi:mRNA-degrading endonuclease RelE of RelBE toxin-antitoxin system